MDTFLSRRLARLSPCRERAIAEGPPRLMGARRKKAQCRSIWNARGMVTVPAVQREMFAMAIPFNRSA